jgi:hypothetical protein
MTGIQNFVAEFLDAAQLTFSPSILVRICDPQKPVKPFHWLAIHAEILVGCQFLYSHKSNYKLID